MKMSQLVQNESQSQPEIIVCVGLPGSGKSYQINKRYPNYTVVSSDNIIERLSAAQGMTYDQGFKQFIGTASTQMNNEFRDAIQNNENIVWDQTNLSAKKRRGILSRVPKHYRTVAMVLDVDADVRQERMGQREGKTIPDHVMQSMAKNYQPPTKDEGFDEITIVKE